MAMNVAAATEEVGPGGTKVISPRTEPLPISEVAKHFPHLEILECLGRGGMGVVYKARQPRLDRLVALKIVAPERENDPHFAERFTREAKALARLSHANIVTVHDFGETDGLFYLIMEFVDGANLRQLIQSRAIAPEEALAIVPKICEALQYAHDQGVVHRDIKPENVLLDKQGRVKIADFGIAKIVGAGGEATLTAAQVIGTPHYMAPEQVEQPGKVDHRADIYSLGVVFYEMLTGELPLGKFLPPSKKVNVDVRLDEVVLHTLEKEPERRYQHASEVGTDVETIVGSPTPHMPARGEKQHDTAVGRAREPGPGNARSTASSPSTEVNPWQPAILLVAGLVSAACLITSTVLPHPVRWVAILFGAVGLIVAAIKLAGLWPFPSGAFPGSTFTRRNLSTFRIQPAAQSAECNREEIHRVIKAPAIGLLVTGILNWVLVPVLALTFLPWLSRGVPDAPRPLVFALPIVILLFCAFVVYAGIEMMRVENRNAAMAASILAMIVSPGNIVGLPVGIWTLVVLCRPDVREAFAENEKSLRGRTAHVWSMVVVVVLLVAGVSVVASLLAFSRRGGWTSVDATSNHSALNNTEAPVRENGRAALKEAKPPSSVDQVIVEDLALQMLVAIRDKDDATLKSLATDQTKGWTEALPMFALEMRERFLHITGKPFAMFPAGSLVQSNTAVVKCTGPKELNGIYIALFFTKTPDGWKNCRLQNSPPTISLEKHLANLKARQSPK